MGRDAFEGTVDGDVVRVTTADGEALEGALIRMGGVTLLDLARAGGKGVAGPFGDDVRDVRVLRTATDVASAAAARAMGEPVPGSLRRDRDGYEARLERLASAAAVAPSARRRREVVRQFEAVADEVSLAQQKRAWMLAVARWTRASNEPPTKAAMSGGDATVAERLARPRPQDFDPDPARRRARGPRAAPVPGGVPAVLSALRAAGYRARISVFDEGHEDEVEVLADAPAGPAKGRFSLTGKRTGPGDARTWRVHARTSDTAAGAARARRWERDGSIEALREALRPALDARGQGDPEATRAPMR